jgi:hypothetical protein
MAVVYIEARPKGRGEHASIEDYVVETEGDHVLAQWKTQQEAIDWAKKRPYAARRACPASAKQKNSRSLAAGLRGGWSSIVTANGLYRNQSAGPILPIGDLPAMRLD